jgi:uncharacterized membrane protein (UPF0127 family)
MSVKRNKFLSWLLVVFMLLLVAVAAFYVLKPQLEQHTTLRLGDGVFKARVAKTDAEREKGLSGTAKLRDDQAMLFVFGSDGKWSIWMKDMSYPIDIVWLNKDKKVVHIVKNAPPESYPYESFVSKEDARYVVELPAGTADKKRIVIDKQAAFDENRLEGWKL